jgi:hypothetical protein
MGWVSENKPGHEGFCVGLIEVESPAGNGWTYWRELGMRQGDEVRIEVRRFQVVCTCGWRSAVFFAPRGTKWAPWALFITDEPVDEAARQEWRRHVDGPEPHALLMPVPEGR